MAGIWVKEGNGIRIDLTVLDPIISRVEAKVEALCDPDEESYHRWKDALKHVKISGDYKLLTAYEKFISEENSDPRIIDSFISALYGTTHRYYRSISSMTLEHVRAYWLVRDAIYNAKLRTRNNASHFDSDYRPLYLIVFNDPSKARIMCSIIEARGVIDAKTMRGMLSSIDSSATMLVDGAL
jgi:hypothetical protein